MLIKIVTKSRINLYTLNCQTGPYQPKCKIVFNKNCPKRTLLEGLCKFKAKDMRRRRIGADSSLDLTPSNKHGTNFDDDDDDHVGPLPSSYSVFGNGIKNIFFSLSIINQCTTYSKAM